MLDEIKDVYASLWISASAGTGKTKSLIDRILALLLNGVAPSKILCLTYTNAAASEMLARLSQYINKFYMMSDNELKRELEKLKFHDVSSYSVKMLYEQSMDPSNWVQIKTIHSFCFSVLEKFPMETGLLPGVKICNAYQAKCLMDEALNHTLSKRELRKYFECISKYTTDIDEITKKNSTQIADFLSKHDDFTRLYCDFFHVNHENLFLPEDELDEFLLNDIFLGNHKEVFLELAHILKNGEKSDVENANVLLESAYNTSAGFTKAFLTDKNTVRSRLYTKKLSKKYPDIIEKMEDAAQCALRFYNEKKGYLSANANISICYVLKEVISKFNELKRKNHYIDFGDVISITSTLLNNAEWVMYKIDGGVDHVLVDEAQDTSPEQWEIIKLITDEFFTNYKSEKTIFIVGDEKQSIYSFQGADVHCFQKMHKYFRDRSQTNGQRFHDVTLNKSYRTTGKILSFVDQIFAGTFPDVRHETSRDGLAGYVEIPKLFEDDEIAESPPWEVFKCTTNFRSSEKKVADYIANIVKHAVENRIFVKSKNRAAIPSDFLILFQRRNIKAMKNIIASLQKLQIPVAGIDKVQLKEELIVEDLMAFAEFSLLSGDDLSCALVLKSPIVGIAEDELIELCVNRKEQSLWGHALQHDVLCQKYELLFLQSIVENVHSMSAYDYFICALNSGMKEKFLNHFGEKCLEILFEFLDVVMIYENENTASLQGFVRWFKSFEHEIKREFVSNENAVILMTAHGSKGLQAPFVVLADTHFFRPRNEQILWSEYGVLVWNFSTDYIAKEISELVSVYSELKNAELKRLLYVAMTRAEDFLYILGEQKKSNPNCWANFISQNLSGIDFEESEFCEIASKRIGEYTEAKHFHGEASAASCMSEQNEIPSWLFEKEDRPQAKNEREKKTEQMLFGDCVHFLLSEMPQHRKYFEISFDDFADRLLERFDASDDTKKIAKSEACKILVDPRFDFIFDEKSLSELSFIRNAQERRIDKIAVRDNCVWIIDFKTGTPFYPVPQKYASQLLEYKDAVADLLECGKLNFGINIEATIIKTAILWTQTAELTELP